MYVVNKVYAQNAEVLVLQQVRNILSSVTTKQEWTTTSNIEKNNLNKNEIYQRYKGITVPVVMMFNQVYYRIEKDFI
jgi:hypothetical protein